MRIESTVLALREDGGRRNVEEIFEVETRLLTGWLCTSKTHQVYRRSLTEEAGLQ
jgi:hypothetical protein